MSERIRQDLSRKLQQSLADVVQRELAIVSVVLAPSELAIPMIEAAVMMMRSMAATVASYAASDADVEMIFDSTVQAMTAGALGSRDDSLRQVQAARSEKRA